MPIRTFYTLYCPFCTALVYEPQNPMDGPIFIPDGKGVEVKALAREDLVSIEVRRTTSTGSPADDVLMKAVHRCTFLRERQQNGGL